MICPFPLFAHCQYIHIITCVYPTVCASQDQRVHYGLSTLSVICVTHGVNDHLHLNTACCNVLWCTGDPPPPAALGVNKYPLKE